MKFFIEKNTLKKEWKFQLTNIGGKNPKTKDNKIYEFSITRLGKKKINMAQPIETIVIRAQQNFEIAGGLNPMQIEIEEHRVTNILKKYKNVAYKVTPLGLLFPASIKNETKQIFVTGKELNGVKKSILNGNVYHLVSMIDLYKINNWNEIKEQFILVSVAFKHQKVSLS